MTLLTKTKSILPALAKKKSLPEGKRSLLPSLFDFDTDLLNFGFGDRLPSANIRETNKDFKLELAAPGLERKDFKVETENSTLTISVDKKEEKDQNFRRKEYSFNSFCRSFTLPENILSDKIDAHYENGILSVLLPKKEITPVKPKKEIKVA